MLLALAIILPIFAYIVIGVASFRWEIQEHLDKTGHEVSYCYSGYWCEGTASALWLNGVLWPLLIPVRLGWLVGGGSRTLSREARTTKRHARELAEADHRVEIAKRIEEENRILDRQLSEARR